MAAEGSRFNVETVDREQLSVRSLGELLEIQKQAEAHNDQSTVRSLGELLSDAHSGSPVPGRAAAADTELNRQRSSSGAAEEHTQMRPRTLSNTGALIRPERVIALGLDGSDQCKTAFHWYIDELWKEGDQLLLVHIFEVPFLPILSISSGFSIPTDVWQTRIKESTQAAEKLMTQYEAACISYKINYQTVLRSGPPGETMCKVADEHSTDYIVLGCRGRSLLRRTVLGSVSSYMINHAHVPVTVVPHPLRQDRPRRPRTKSK